MARKPSSKRVIDVEAASSSGDRPRVTQRYSMMVPEDGQSVSLKVVARMVPAPENVSTERVESRDDTGGSVGAQCGTLPSALSLLEFSDFENLYKAWKHGAMTMEDIVAKQVAELIVTHEMVAQEDVDTLQGVEGGVVHAENGGPAVPSAEGQNGDTGLTDAATIRAQEGGTQMESSGDAMDADEPARDE